MVIGGYGFLGRRIVQHLLSKCTRVKSIIIYDIKCTNVNWDDSRVTFINGSITDRSTLIASMFNVDVVFHCAEVKYKSDLDLELVNYTGTLNIINACLLNNVRCLIYNGKFCFNRFNDYFYNGDEYTDYYPTFSDTYAKTKYLAEVNICKADKSKTILGTILRTCSIKSFGIYGENNTQFKQLFLNAFSKKTAFNWCYNHAAFQSKTYVGNVAWMHILAYKTLYNSTKADRAGGEIYFCYDNSPCLSTDEFNKIFLAEFNITTKSFSKPVLKTIARFNDFLLKWKQDVIVTSDYLKLINTYCVFDTTKAANELDYAPLYSWSDSKYNVLSWLLTLV